MSSSYGATGHGTEEKTESKRIGKSKKSRVLLFGEPYPDNVSAQHNSVSLSDGRNFPTATVKDFEQSVLRKSHDTGSSMQNAIRIAEYSKGVATATLETLRHQGEQIRRSHETAVRLEQELGRSEKLLRLLGSMWWMTWKPKKAHRITGPQFHPDEYERQNHVGERSALGLSGETPSRPSKQLSGTSSAQAQLEEQKNKQDEALTDLSNLLRDLKGLALEIGYEIQTQNGDLHRMHDDMNELNARFKGANKQLDTCLANNLL